MDTGISVTTLYTWRKRRPEKLDLGNAALILTALSKLTGEPYTLNDLIQYHTPKR